MGNTYMTNTGLFYKLNRIIMLIFKVRAFCKAVVEDIRSNLSL